MNSKRYLVKLQFLGFRYHGIQKQSHHQSIQGKIEDVLSKNFSHNSFKTRFASRTDALVSALETYFLLMFSLEEDQSLVKEVLFGNFPADIKILEVTAVENHFTMIKASELKEYHYYFSFGGERNHPFSSAFITQISESLDIEKMKAAAHLFVGRHNFINYCYRPKELTPKERVIVSSEVLRNDVMTATFFPEHSYYFKVKAPSFMRGQVRIMMGTLIRVGLGEISLEDLSESLKKEDPSFIKFQAPAAGLVLYKTQLKNSPT